MIHTYRSLRYEPSSELLLITAKDSCAAAGNVPPPLLTPDALSSPAAGEFLGDTWFLDPAVARWTMIANQASPVAVPGGAYRLLAAANGGDGRSRIYMLAGSCCGPNSPDAPPTSQPIRLKLRAGNASSSAAVDWCRWLVVSFRHAPVQRC